MATKQGLRIQMPGIFATVVFFVLAYSTTRSASKPYDEKSEVYNWYESLSSDPTHPWHGQKLPPQPHDKFNLYAKDCLDSIGDKKCVRQIFDGLFDKTKIDVECGCKIKKMGRMCLMAVVGITGHMDKYKVDAGKIYKRALKISDKADKLSKCPAT